MLILGGLDELPAGTRFALAIGMFDGVHRGHQRTLRRLVRVAREMRAKSVVLTFEPHPSQVLRGRPPLALSTRRECLARINDLDVDMLVAQPFDHAFADQTPAEFLARICAGRELAAVVMTAESAFGRDRVGILTEIRRLGAAMKFRVVEVERLASTEGTLSSTRIRSLLAAGRLAEARRVLGRPYAVVGTVVRGDRRGRGLGFPTANLSFAVPVALPPDGVYAVRVGWGLRRPLAPEHARDGVASLGVRPTFGGGERLLEVHLFDFEGNLYGRQLRVEFARRLRGEKRFESAEALVSQMKRDASRARSILAKT